MVELEHRSADRRDRRARSACSSRRAAHEARAGSASASTIRDVGALHGHGDLDVAEDRSGPRPLPPDRARQDQAEPAQVHLAGRADRAKKGKDTVVDPDAADRHPALPLRRQAAGRRRAGRRRRRRPARPGRAEQPGTGKAGDQAGRSPARGRLTLEELAADPRRGARAAAHRAQGQEQIVAQKDKLHRASARTGPESLRHFRRTYRAGAAAADRDGHVRREEPAHRARSARTSATARGSTSRCRSRTPSSST